jgi:hypothetical protein
MLNFKTFLVSIAAIGIVGCNGGSSNPANTVESTPQTESAVGDVTTSITDNLSQDYAEVWVTITSVYALNANGEKFELYSELAGSTFNLSELTTQSRLLSQVSIPAGTYTSFVIEAKPAITLIDSFGKVTPAKLQGDYSGGNDSDVEIRVAGLLTVSESENAELMLDFDLARFTYTESTNSVSPVIAQLAENQTRTRYAEFEGFVTSVGSDSLQLQSEYFSQPVTLVTGTFTNFFNQQTGRAFSPKLGDRIEVVGAYQPDAPNTITAKSVRLEDPDTQDYGRNEVEGRIVSVVDNQIMLDVREADFMPPSNELSIYNLTNATFETGDITSLAAGQWVEVKGIWQGTGEESFEAQLVQIEGASRVDYDASTTYSDSYVEVEGLIDSMSADGSVLTVNVVRSGDDDYYSSLPAVAKAVSVDVSSAWFEDQSESCLGEGKYIEAKGAVTSSGSGPVLLARTVELEGFCGNSQTPGPDDGASWDWIDTSDERHESDDFDYDGNDEVEGIIQTVDAEVLALKLYEVKGFNPGAVNSIEVNVNGAWYDDGSSVSLLPGRYVEFEGSWDGSQFKARKIDFD